MHHTRRSVNDIAGVQFDHRTALDLSPRHTLLDQNDLPAFVAVPLRPGSRRESKMSNSSVRAFLYAGHSTGEIGTLLGTRYR